jgi:predicted AlkP superfamily pyrophosphatase or phosphodiesterase
VDSYGFFPTIFAQLRDQRPESQIGYFYEWSGMKYLCPRDVPDRMRHFLLMSYVKTGVNSIARYIKKEKPTLTTVIFYKPDLIGHSKGHDTPEYYRGLHEADSYIGVLVQAVKDAGIYENTVFVLSADHGGDGTGHGGESMAERQIPVIFSGKNIQKGHYITAPVRNYDIAPTMARLLDIAAPDIWIGTSIDEVFIESSQFN